MERSRDLADEDRRPWIIVFLARQTSTASTYPDSVGYHIPEAGLHHTSNRVSRAPIYQSGGTKGEIRGSE